MWMKPFRPPRLLRKSTESETESLQARQDAPPAKKRRISPQLGRENNHRTPAGSNIHNPPPATFSNTGIASKNTAGLHGYSAEKLGSPVDMYYNVLWRNFKIKKHKTWDGDGILLVGDGYATLLDHAGKQMGRTPCRIPLLPDEVLFIGAKEVQIESVIPSDEYESLRLFQGALAKRTMKPLDDGLGTKFNFCAAPKVVFKDAKELHNHTEAIIPSIQASRLSFKIPLKENTVMPRCNGETPVPRHDPSAPGALIMKRPAINLSGKQLVDVVVDPLLAKNLREHQRVGVQFLYECVMSMRPFCGDGAILADEMGLGKTLQVITLLWTLMKQNPIHGDQPVIKKALIVCPVTLIKNWKKEFRKWLGRERVGVFVLEDKRTRLTDFTRRKSYNIMIIGYEKLRTVLDDLKKGDCIDIVIADEGHRLKTEKNKSAQAIKSLRTSRKIILSGTPLQNDLSEFYFMVDFVNPGLLGKVNSFKREFETPILQSRQPGASANDIEKGEERSSELANLTSLFILRRTADILAKYLPPKTEYVLFCRPTVAQASVYRNLLSSSIFSSALNTPEASFQLIDILKKLCNSPSLLRARAQAEENDPSAEAPSLLSSIPPALLHSPGASGKLQVLDSLLHHIYRTKKEKVVIISHYTATLDVLENLLSSLEYSFLRLDGSTSQPKRQDLVDKFNSSNAEKCFAFLLSAKSGGMGLNLTGASRCILFDCSWNPSTDLQAMARIHRDGQRRPCMIYRLLTKGALDEKIYQRQLTKLSLADSVVDNKVSASSFTREELRDLFRLDDGEECQTHELLGCLCGGNGMSHNLTPPLAPYKDTRKTRQQDKNEGEEFADLIRQTEEAELDIDEKESPIEEVSQTEIKSTISKASNQMALMRYQHFCTAKLLEGLQSGGLSCATNARNEGYGGDLESVSEDMNTMLQDTSLMGMLREPENRVSFVFAKRSL